MKLLPSFCFLIAVGMVGVAPVGAEKADRSRPMHVEADALRYDEAKQTSIFSGHVVLTKGTIVIRGSKIEVRQDAQGHQFGSVSSEQPTRAFFRQKREGVDEFIEGEAESIEYDGRTDTVKFVNNALMRRYRGATLSDEFTGGLIVYNNTTDVFTIDGAPARPGAGTVPGAGRVRAMLTPKPQGGAVEPASTSPPTTPALRSTTTLGGDKQ